jgi:uncharacterized protein
MPRTTVDPQLRVQRHPERGRYDRASLEAILDEGLVAHVGFVHEGRPVVIPTHYGRDEELLYVHGSPASRMLGDLAHGIELCLTVTLIDGLVLARSAFHHSTNYRSVVVFGRAHRVDGADEKLRALEVITEHIVPGRWAKVRSPDARELATTLVLAIPLEGASAKVRTGPPADDPRDAHRATWAGVLPLHLEAGRPEPDAGVPDGVDVPPYVRGYVRRQPT